MTQKKKQTVPKGKAGQVRGPELSGRRVSVDIVTGLEVNSVYFDPDEAIPGETSEDSWQSRYEHLYEPGVVLRDHGNDVISVKLGNGDVFKMNSKAAVKVTESGSSRGKLCQLFTEIWKINSNLCLQNPKPSLIDQYRCCSQKWPGSSFSSFPSWLSLLAARGHRPCRQHVPAPCRRWTNLSANFFR